MKLGRKEQANVDAGVAENGLSQAMKEKAPKVRRRLPKVTTDMTSALVSVINMPLLMIAPEYALSEVEATALAVALADAAKQNQWIAAFLYNLVTATSWTELPMVVGAIAVNKLAAAGKLPEATTVASGMILEVIAAKAKRPAKTGKEYVPDKAGQAFPPEAAEAEAEAEPAVKE